MPKVLGDGPVLQAAPELDSTAGPLVDDPGAVGLAGSAGGVQAVTTASTPIQHPRIASIMKLPKETLNAFVGLGPAHRESTRAAILAAVRFLLIGLGLVAACARPVEDRELRLAVDASTVEPRLAELGVLSVEVYGVRETTTLCTLARRCFYPLDLGDPRSGEELQAALREVRPLVEVDAAVAHQVAVVGRTGGLCDEQGPFLLCGFADLGAAHGDELDVALAEDQCPAVLPPFCPG